MNFSTNPSLHVETLSIEARGLRFPALACGEGPLVLCLHGFPDTQHSFRHQLPALAAAGYRAVAPALRGYAPSCLPPLDACDVLEAAHDAVAIVDALGASRAHLVGHDWGAVAAYLAGALGPQRWQSITTLAVPHPLGLIRQLRRVPRQLRLSWYMLFFQLPELPERTIAARDFAFLEWLWRRWSPGWSLDAQALQALKAAFAQPGVVPAALAYYRALFALGSANSVAARRLLSRRIEAPLLALTGADDGCIDTRTYQRSVSKRWFARARVETLPGVGHFLHAEDPGRVNTLILDWMAASAGRSA